MRKELQKAVNEYINMCYDFILKEAIAVWDGSKEKQLRTCNAYVTETENFYVLRSYNTFVAAIDKNTNTLYDFLRLVYGYTATSAQHIRKFACDYAGIDGYMVYTYRPVD